MKSGRRALSVALALMLATAAVFGAAMMADQHTGYDTSPVGDSKAVAPVAAAAAGVVIIGAAKVAHDHLTTAPKDEKLAETDAYETKVEIYRTASTQQANNDIIQTSQANYANDSKSIARMVGKQAYIQSLNNGSSLAAAQVDAKTAIQDYYASRQLILLETWRNNIDLYEKLHKSAENTSNMSGLHLTGDAETTGFLGINKTKQGLPADDGEQFNFTGFKTTQISLINKSTRNVPTMEFRGYGLTPAEQFHVIKPGKGPVTVTPDGDDYGFTLNGLVVKKPDKDFKRLTVLNLEEFATRWNQWEQANSQVQSNVQTFINGTYDAYQRGEISTGDMVDPYLGARNYSPDENFESWAMRSHAAMGIAPPENVGEVGRMTVTSDGQTYEGILMSEAPPESGAFKTGQQYDASALSGSQYMMDSQSGEMVPLNGQFTVESAETTDGKNLDKVDYSELDYQTTSTEEYRQRMQKMQKTLAEINARQQALRNQGGGGGGGLFDGLGVPPVQALVVAFLALLAIGIVTRS